MKTLIGSLLLILSLSCSNEPGDIQLPTSAQETYNYATQQGQLLYDSVLIQYSQIDSDAVIKNNPAIRDINLKLSIFTQNFVEAGLEVKELEKLHPQYSDSKVAKAYRVFCSETLHNEYWHAIRMRDYEIKLITHETLDPPKK